MVVGENIVFGKNMVFCEKIVCWLKKNYGKIMVFGDKFFFV